MQTLRKGPKYLIDSEGMRFGFCEKCKIYTISQMADIIHREKLTPDRVLEKDLWIIVGHQFKQGGLPQYTGDFPLKWKEEAIKLAETEKKS